MLKLYFSDELSQEVAGKKPARNPIQPHKLDCTPKAEKKPNGNLESKMKFEKLLDERVENILILVTATAKQTPETCRFNSSKL